MKKVLAIIIIIGATVVFYTMRDNSPVDKNIPVVNDSKSFRPDPSNATFAIDGETVTLSRGRDEKTLEGTAMVEETILLDKLAYGDINADGKEDTALFLASSGGGSGTFI